MPYYHITLTPHPSEIQVFEDFLLFFLPDVKKRKEYYYSVEKDDTSDRHLHCVLLDPSPDTNNFIKKFNKKIYKEFKDSLSSNCSQTIWDVFFKVDKITPGEEQIVIGYTHKDRCKPDDPAPLNRCAVYHHDLSDIATGVYVTDCIKQYYAKERIDARKQCKTDVTLVTTKNFYAKVNDFVKNNNRGSEATPDEVGTCQYNDHLLYYNMVKSGYGFINISKQQVSRGFRELRIMNDQEYDHDIYDTRQELFPDSEANAQEFCKDLQDLLFSNNDYKENLRKKYYWLENRKIT